MSRRERIPTLHELKLAGRVERARALFGPGGYLDLPKTIPTEDHDSLATNSSCSNTVAVPTVACPEDRGEKEKENDQGREDDKRMKFAPATSDSAAIEGSEAGVGSGERGEKVEAPPPPPSPLQSGGSKDVSGKEPPKSAPAPVDDDRRTSTTAGLAGLREALPKEGNEGPPLSADHHGASAKPGSHRSTFDDKKHDGTGEVLRRAVAAGGTGGTGGRTLTTVTLTVVGGRPEGRGFTNLEQSGKVRQRQRQRRL